MTTVARTLHRGAIGASLRRMLGALLMACSCLGASAQQAQSMTIGHSAGKGVTYQRVTATEAAGSALYYSAEELQAFAGCRITEVSIQIDQRVGADSVTVFVGPSLSDQPYVEQHPDTASAGTHVVTLNTPYVISGTEGLFIGYTIVGAKNLCYANTLVSGTEWIKNKSNNEWRQFDNASYSAVLTATVEGENLPHDVRLTQLSMPEYALTGQAVNYTGEILNLGADTVSELALTYYIDGEEHSSETCTGLSVAPRSKGTFALSSLILPTECTASVQIELSTVNGKPNSAPTDKLSRTQSVICRKEFAKRKVLMEVFSTERCPNCPSAHEYLEKIFKGANDLIEVGHHAGFYTDDFTISASTDYEWFYKPGKLYAPAIMMDRTNRATDFAEAFADDVPVISAATQYTLPIYEACRATPAWATVEVNADFDANTRHLVLDVAGSQLLPLDHPDEARLFVLLTEDSLYTTTQRGATDGFYHRHAARQMLSATWGDEITLSDGYAKRYEADIPTEWNANHMRAVAYVANYDSNDRNNCRVWAAEAVELATNQPLAIREARDTSKSLLELADGRLTLAGGGKFSLYSVSGKLMAENVTATTLPARGIYVARIVTPTGTSCVKVAY